MITKAVEKCYRLAGAVAVKGLTQYTDRSAPGKLTATASDLNDLWWAADLLARGLVAGVHPSLSKESLVCLTAAGGAGCTPVDTYKLVTSGLLFPGNNACIRFPRQWQFIDPPGEERQIGEECLQEIVVLSVWSCIVLGRPVIPQHAGSAASQLIARSVPQPVADMLTIGLRDLWLQ